MEIRHAAGARLRTPEPDGPILVDGPVQVVLDDGTEVGSDRSMVAVCTCLRSKRYPFCDTSHRARVRSATCPNEDREAAS